MILTLCYMYATLVQWWRLGVLRQRLSGTLHKQNALLLCSSPTCIGSQEDAQRSLENLLYQQEGRIACTIVPRQNVHLGQWASFPKDRKSFPLHYRCSGSSSSFRCTSSSSKVHLLLQASLESGNKPTTKIDFVRMEQFGELVAWRAQEFFEVVLKSDLDRLTILMNSFRFHAIGINHDLHLIKVEAVDVTGIPGKIKYDRRLSKQRFSRGPAQIQEFATCLRQLYFKVNRQFNPKITIENGTTTPTLPPAAIVKPPEVEKKPVSEVKPIRKSTKNTLDVHHSATKKKREKHATSTPAVAHVKDEQIKQEPSAESKSEVSVENKKSYSDVTATPAKNLQRQNATSLASKETSPNRQLPKPPNILVYADTTLAKENVKAVLKTIINKDKYTVYDFPAQAGENFWNDTTTLVVVCGQVPAALTSHLLGYLIHGGQLLCLCSDLLYSVLQPFSTAEVREHELVRFSYGEWKRVKMMHHIFCYQASPAKKQFSREASDAGSMGSTGSAGSSPVAPRTPSIVEVHHEGRRHTIQVQVLGAEETWQTPSLLLAAVRDSNGGKAVFSQVHLEVDPTQYQDDESKFTALKDSNQARLEIMKHILSTHLDIDCSVQGNSAEQLKYEPAYFLGRHDLKMLLINGGGIVDGRLKLPELEVSFVAKNIDDGPLEAKVDKLPVMVLQCPTNFSTVEYFDTLVTERVGRLVIYADVMASTQYLLAQKLADGLVVIARRQTAGKGRSGNEWLSPDGCAMFSLQLHIPLDSHLGRSIPVVQHLVMLGVVLAAKSASGLQTLDIGLKWPNDLYAYGNVKIGGLVASSIIERDLAVVSVGCGINLSNRQPTLCINDIISEAQKSRVDASLSPEKFFAATFNEVEKLIENTQREGVNYLLDLYYRHWLHTNANITVVTADGASKNVTIRGMDLFGFLEVQDDAGVISSVQPDGNTFDMLRGLIAPKITSC